MKNSLLLMLISVSFFMSGMSSGCRDRRERDIVAIKVPGTEIIQGKITTNNGTIPLKNTLVEIYWVGSVTPGSTRDGKIIRKKNTTKTDENGFYDFRVLVRQDERNQGLFRVVLPTITPEYFTYVPLPTLPENNIIFLTELPVFAPVIANYSLEKKANLTLSYTLGSNLPANTRYVVKVKEISNLNAELFYLNLGSGIGTLPNSTVIVPSNTQFSILVSTINNMNSTIIDEKTYTILPISANGSFSYNIIL